MKTIQYAPKYRIDADGTVHGQRGVLKPRTVGYVGNGTSYQQVILYHNRKRIPKYVHVLVAEHYMDGYTPTLQVNHKDGNKTNNHLDNLEQVDAHENMVHAAATGLIDIRGDNHPKRKRGVRTRRLTQVQQERATTIP